MVHARFTNPQALSQSIAFARPLHLSACCRTAKRPRSCFVFFLFLPPAGGTFPTAQLKIDFSCCSVRRDRANGSSSRTNRASDLVPCLAVDRCSSTVETPFAVGRAAAPTGCLADAFPPAWWEAENILQRAPGLFERRLIPGTILAFSKRE